MYGLIGKMRATPGQRDALLAILLDGTDAMPGCLSYVIAQDPADADAIWITEVWTDAASHKASLSLPAVQQAIARARPLIAGFDSHIETVPVGGQGLNLCWRDVQTLHQLAQRVVAELLRRVVVVLHQRVLVVLLVVVFQRLLPLIWHLWGRMQLLPLMTYNQQQNS